MRAFSTLTACAVLVLVSQLCLLGSAAHAADMVEMQTALENFLQTAAPASRAAARDASLDTFFDSTWYFDYDADGWEYDRFEFDNFLSSIAVDSTTQADCVTMVNQDGESGYCATGESLGYSSYDYACIHGDNTGEILYDFTIFNLNDGVVSGVHASQFEGGTYSSTYALSGGMIGGQSVANEDDAEYYIPYLPTQPDFALGYAFSNAANADDNVVNITFYNNAGESLGSQGFTIPAGGQGSNMANVQPDEPGWAIVQASLPLSGMGLIFGVDNLMYDVDIVPETSKNLSVNHVAIEGGWKTKALLCNPNPYPADVTVTLHPKAGGSSTSDTFSIPAMGAVQYDLSALGGEGSAAISSTQPLAGFELYDGRDGTGYNWLGGLSITVD